jgi:sorbitol-6-phosphate 2-dehydrogenase
VEDGIKVNSICPGNFFDGPLWSDPGNGLFAQYLRSGKVPGAKTIAGRQTILRSQGPHGPRLHDRPM